MRYNLDTKSRLFLPDYRFIDDRLSYKNYCAAKVLRHFDIQRFAGDTFNESFEGDGYENAWSETVGDGNTLDEDSAGPGSLPTGGGSQCLQSIQAGTNAQAYATIDFGAAMTVVYCRFYLYIDSFDTNDTDVLGIFQLAGAVENLLIGLRYTAQYGTHLYGACYANGDQLFVATDEFVFSEDTWYRIEGKYDSDADVTEIKVDGVSIDTYSGGNALRVDTDRINIGQCGFWNVGTNANTGANTLYFDLVSIDSSDWIGAESGGGVTLTVADLSHTISLDTPILTQAHTLSGVGELVHSHTLDAPTLTQAHTLVMQALLHGHSLEAPTLTQKHLLSITGLDHNHTLDTPSLTQAHILALTDLTHGHSLDGIALTQAHLLTLAGLSHGHTLDGILLTQKHTLIIAGLDHSHALDTPTLTQAHVLSIADLAHSHILDNVVLATGTLLVVSDLTHTHTVDNVALVQAHVIVIDNLGHAHSLGTVNLTQAHLLALQDLLHAHNLDAVTLSADVLMEIQELLSKGYISQELISKGVLSEELTSTRVLSQELTSTGILSEELTSVGHLSQELTSIMGESL